MIAYAVADDWWDHTIYCFKNVVETLNTEK